MAESNYQQPQLSRDDLVQLIISPILARLNQTSRQILGQIQSLGQELEIIARQMSREISADNSEKPSVKANGGEC